MRWWTKPASSYRCGREGREGGGGGYRDAHRQGLRDLPVYVFGCMRITSGIKGKRKHIQK